MKKNPYILNVLLTAVLFAVLAFVMVGKVLFPAVNFPQLNIPNMVLLSLAALLLSAFLGAKEVECWGCAAVLAVLSFTLLPLMAGFTCWHTCWKTGLIGGAVFTVTGLLFTSVRQRLISGGEGKGALLVTAFVIYLAAQAFTAILL